ncbi:Wzz/FepE/Etk N-terminal domain-containing protein [uncultured Tolumonas sp.]|uniref:LPS O-antigen chain length determinant protein WzzB n=1 Tax=uncultured Tolumonas sp. TaxID=263765 RepID=UPI002A0A2DCE|nr:Wzz/FepE/Etk N-terminal domain-containing protein [uncultured Tolumonas sp.]
MNKKEFSQQANMPYPYPMPYQDNDEIDLVELFRTLWKQKAKIALITVVTTLASGIYAFTAEEVWTSNAVITAPKASDMGEFYLLAQNLERNAPIVVTPDGVQTKTEDAKQLQFANLQTNLFKEFKNTLNSLDERREFVVSSDFYKEKIKGKTERDQKVILKEITEKDINYTAADDVKKTFDTITLSADTSKQSQILLQQYIASVNAKVVKNNEYELKLLLNKFRQDLAAEAKTLETSADDMLMLQIKSVSDSLAQAKEMNLIETSANLPTDISDSTMYLLGSKALSAKLASLKASEPTLAKRYFDVQQQLKTLNEIKNSSVTGQAFCFIDMPDEPVTKDKPKRVLILIGGALLGLFGSVFFFSILFSLKKKNK